MTEQESGSELRPIFIGAAVAFAGIGVTAFLGLATETPPRIVVAPLVVGLLIFGFMWLWAMYRLARN